MPWTVLFHREFQVEFEALPEDIQDELLARTGLLGQFGPALGRPNVDTLKGSKFQNMKELRFQLDGVWRFAFAFDPNRNAIILVGGDKKDEDSGDFYKDLIATADRRFTAHIASVKSVKKGAREP
jgi:hypothetical protein